MAWILVLPLLRSHSICELRFPHLKTCVTPTVEGHGLSRMSEKTRHSFCENAQYPGTQRHSSCYWLLGWLVLLVGECPCPPLSEVVGTKQARPADFRGDFQNTFCLFTAFYATSWFTKPI